MYDMVWYGMVCNVMYGMVWYGMYDTLNASMFETDAMRMSSMSSQCPGRISFRRTGSALPGNVAPRSEIMSVCCSFWILFRFFSYFYIFYIFVMLLVSSRVIHRDSGHSQPFMSFISNINPCGRDFASENHGFDPASQERLGVWSTGLRGWMRRKVRFDLKMQIMADPLESAQSA